MPQFAFSDLQVALFLLFGSTLFLAEGLYYLVRDTRGASAANRRMRLIAAGADRDTVLAQLRRSELDRISALIVRILPALQRLLREAGLTIAPTRVVTIGAAIALAVAAGLSLLALPPQLIVLLSGAAGFGVPTIGLRSVRARRLKQFGDQMPEALDMMVRSLHAGHPIAAAISLVASEMSDPTGSECGIVVDEMTYGYDLGTALDNFARRMPHPDLKFFVVAVQIQKQTGGNLAEVLSNLSSVIRARMTMKLKVKAITAQSRSSAFIVGIVPLLTIGLINVIAPDYFGAVVDDPMFMPAMALAAVLWAGGLFMIYRLVQFRI